MDRRGSLEFVLVIVIGIIALIGLFMLFGSKDSGEGFALTAGATGPPVGCIITGNPAQGDLECYIESGDGKQVSLPTETCKELCVN